MDIVIEVTKTDLVKAMHLYNTAYLENPDSFTEIDDSEETAELQVEHLLKCLVEVRENAL